jgi:hypothetical protein
MAISRCNKCGNVTEHERELVGTTIVCQCGASTAVYDTAYFVNKLSEMYFALRKEFNALGSDSSTPSQTQLKKNGDTLDIHNSDSLSCDAQHAPIVQWFKSKNITAIASINAVDTTGFFDEAAVAIGNDYELLGVVCEQIRYAQLKEYTSNLIHLEKKSKEDAKAIEVFVQRLYVHSLIARCISNKKEKNIRVVLQNAPSVRRFFAGDWLEWFALMVGLRICQERNINFSCARNMTLAFPSSENRELDVFFLINNNQPLYIECKTGDFRQDLDKYVALRKRLAIEQRYFILCVADLDSEQCKGLTAMYGMTFVNTRTLGQHLTSLL